MPHKMSHVSFLFQAFFDLILCLNENTSNVNASCYLLAVK
jgi:hypothetical protein